MPFRCTVARGYSRVAVTNRGTYALARWARAAVPRDKWVGPFVTPGGIKLELDLSTYPDCGMALDLYETETLRLLKKLLRLGGHFVDCGANLGYFSLHLSRWVGGHGRVDAFEPDPINRARLEAHLQLNQIANVRVHPLAVSSKSGRLDFYHPTGALNHGQASVFASLVPQGKPFAVDAARLDEAIDAVPDVIKIDVEGAELNALRGAEAWLKSNTPPALIIEHNHESSAAGGYRPSDIFNYLTTVQPRYRIFWIGWRRSPIQSAEALDAIARQGNILAIC